MIRTLVILLGLTAAVHSVCPASNELAGLVAGTCRPTQAPSLSQSPHPTATRAHPRTPTASTPHSPINPASPSVLLRSLRHFGLRPDRIGHRPLRRILSAVRALRIRPQVQLQVRTKSLALAATRILGQHPH